MNSSASPDGGKRVAYVMSRFPKLTETFVLYEMQAIERLGHRVEVFPLLRHREPVRHAAAEEFVRRAHFRALFSPAVIWAHAYFIARRPAAYFRTWWEILRGTWGSLNFFLGAVGFLPKVVRFAYDMERMKIDHIHAHFANHPAAAALAIHRLTGIPYSFTAHAFDIHVDRRMLPRKIEAAAFVVTISDFNRRLMCSECGASESDKVHVIHCGVDPNEFAPGRQRAETRPCVITCVAALEELKGHRYLIEACAELRDRGVDFECRIVGRGSRERELREHIARLGLGDCVRMLGGRPRAEVVRMLTESDIAVLASAPTRGGKHEGIPVALMEAMACGLPVVASDMTGVPELVEHGRTGLLVKPADVRGLADALEALASDADLRRLMGAAGREKVQREFDQQRSAATLASLFERARQYTPARSAG